jgi:hypothetical protein
LRLLEALSGGKVTFELRWSVLGSPAAARRPLQLRTVDLDSLITVADDSEAYYTAGVAERAPGLAPAALPEIVENFGLSGRVTALRRSYVTVEGLVNGRTRGVRVVVDDERMFQRAVTGFARDLRVRAVGRLVVRPRTSVRLESVSRFEVLDDA